MSVVRVQFEQAWAAWPGSAKMRLNLLQYVAQFLKSKQQRLNLLQTTGLPQYGQLGHGTGNESLFYSALLCAREMLIPEEVSVNLVQALNNRLVGSRIKSLSFVQQLLEYTRPFRVNIVLYYLIVESFPCILSEQSMQC